MKSFLNEVASSVDYVSLRSHDQRYERLFVKRNVFQPSYEGLTRGIMITVCDKGGLGYAATSDLTRSGLKRAFDKACDFARTFKDKMVVDYAQIPWHSGSGEYRTQVKTPWDSVSKTDKINLLMNLSRQLPITKEIVHWEAELVHTTTDKLILNSLGAEVFQRIETIVPDLDVVASRGAESFSRTFGAGRVCYQGGLEILSQVGYETSGVKLAQEALSLLDAEECPTGAMDLLLAPDQMILQIHESIGHPLELDRILGDERNMAGRSFVTPDMFGNYQYGSPLLNITFDPAFANEAASYGFDDEGTKAQKEYLIKDGILVRALGGTVSQSRSEVPGVSCARACDWNRPAIDRMANLNLEPGTATFDELVAGVEKGVYMRSNSSWSIDDSRRKFQFGCEIAQLIEDGELTRVVRKPNYRGVSSTFWRNLIKVGNKGTAQTLGSPYCGKGEPNQVISVGHASPACLFKDVQVFGGGR
ncbi:MAG: TldD/PmbA family protein [Oligoflexales bacterium]